MAHPARMQKCSANHFQINIRVNCVTLLPYSKIVPGDHTMLCRQQYLIQTMQTENCNGQWQQSTHRSQYHYARAHTSVCVHVSVFVSIQFIHLRELQPFAEKSFVWRYFTTLGKYMVDECCRNLDGNGQVCGSIHIRIALKEILECLKHLHCAHDKFTF